MSRKDGRDFIYLIWKDIITRTNYIVGQLSKNGKYEFSYGHEVEEAMGKGFELLISFPELDKVYENDILFSTFSSRLPDRKRRGIEKILGKYGLKEFDAYELLKRSGVKLPIDNLEFIDPIFEENGYVCREFYIAGIRHYAECKGSMCDKLTNIELEQYLELNPEPQNEIDSNAIKIQTEKGEHLGYIPRYYCEPILERLSTGSKCKCTIIDVKKDNSCQECVRVKLELND